MWAMAARTSVGVEEGGTSTRHWPMLVRIRMIMVEDDDND